METWLVAGLGNPGAEYACNRHNVGFLFLDYVAERLSAGSFTGQRALQGRRVTARLAGRSLLLLKPETYMNLSGASVAAALSYFKILSERAVICYDDVDIPFGSFRIRLKGSSGGHRGLESIIGHVGPDVVRLRFGIKPACGRRGRLADFVLSDFASSELQCLRDDIFPEAFDALKMIVSGRAAMAMNRYNRRRIESGPVDKE